MIKVLDLTVERVIFKKIKDTETGKESELAKVLYVSEEEDFYIGYLSKYDADKINITPDMRVQAIFDKGKIKLIG